MPRTGDWSLKAIDTAAPPEDKTGAHDVVSCLDEATSAGLAKSRLRNGRDSLKWRTLFILVS
jgi:hypothetical protein